MSVQYALHSSIGQNIKSLACPVSDIRSPISDVRSECEKLKKTSNDHNSATRHTCLFLQVGENWIALFNLTAHELGT